MNKKHVPPPARPSTIMERVTPCEGKPNISKVLLKGALDNFSLIPPSFFKKVKIFIPLEVYTYVVIAYLILLATSSLLQSYVNFSCGGHF